MLLPDIKSFNLEGVTYDYNYIINKKCITIKSKLDIEKIYFQPQEYEIIKVNMNNIKANYDLFIISTGDKK